MNLTELMHGKLTKSACYALIASGLYTMSVEIGQLLHPPVEYVTLIADLLRGDGFKLFMAGWVGYGLRRAMTKGGAELPPLTDEEKQEEAAKLKAMLSDVETTLTKLKGSVT